MNIRLTLLPCSLLLFSCTEITKDQTGNAPQGQVADEAVQPIPVSEEMVAAVALPEVRYYLVADN